ncbi:major facilitator superfamily MFS-1 [Fusarium pseudoanthophilum]|uniref:Major facilitator superfamily MFS-1 n=1 Tax=Fusarium pseudoanthophilum TaxID=48495 RepID=A0A8H5P2H2_9HYPO|nr:major facilitator superfamily MFS-1 [Fusarium pseudoanthophilum]
MDFGQNSIPELDNQIQTYHFAPNFSILPSPRGRLHLGTLVNNLKDCAAINFGIHNRVPISDERRTFIPRGGINMVQQNSSGRHGRTLGKVFHAIRNKISAQRSEYYYTVWTIESLETTDFEPEPTYYKKCLQLADVVAFQELNNYKDPVYLITGLKTARGATMATRRGRILDGDAEAIIQGPEGLVDVRVGVEAGAYSDADLFSSFSEPADFVIGIQVKKLYYKRPFFGGTPTLKVKSENEGAVLADDGPTIKHDNTDEVEYEIRDLDEEDMKGFTIVKDEDEDEAWVLPSELA